MPAIGAITRSGLLYEGIFEEWLPRMLDVLAVRNCLDFEACYKDGRLTELELEDESADEPSQSEVWDLITGHISPNIVARMPAPGYFPYDIEALFQELQGSASAFRLLDLPANIRHCIFSLHFEQMFPNGEARHIWLDKTHGLPKPAICHVSKQLKNELSFLAS